MKKGASLKILVGGLALVVAGPAYTQRDGSSVSNPNQPPPHTRPFPSLGSGKNAKETANNLALAPQLQRGVPARELLEQKRRLDKSLGALKPQRAGTVDAYVLTIALDSDPVFAREAREAASVLSRRYDGEGRTIALAGPDGVRDDLPRGSIENLLVSIARISEVMDRDEDVLVLYTTSHGAKIGLAYHFGDTGYGILSPTRLRQTFDEVGITRRLVIISACYSGVFVPQLASADTAILTAASSERTSFGCASENDWTFFGDALINRAMRQPQPLADVVAATSLTIAGWETQKKLLASLPQSSIGADVATWLTPLEARMPKTATQSVGRPAVAD